MKQPLLILLILAFTANISLAQGGQFTSQADNDPAATAILEKVKTKYQAYNEITTDFDLIISYPEEADYKQKGTLTRQGDMYHLKMPQHEVFCNGESIAMVLHSSQEVQLNDMPDEEDQSLLTPQSIFDFYDSGEYTYLLVNDISEGGKVLHQIEFKPLDKDNDYFKIRLTVDKKTKAIVRAKTFSGDGSRYTFILGETKTDEQHNKEYYTFHNKMFPGYYLEDLRE